MSNNLLFDSPPIVIPRKLAELVGINEAAVLQQIHYWCDINEKAKRNYRDGDYWVYNSISKWLEEFPWLSKSTLERVFSKLKKENLIIVAHYSQRSFNRTNWYRINYDALNALRGTRSPQNEVINNPILTETITKINTEINTNSDSPLTVNPTTAESLCVENDNCLDPEEKVLSNFIDWYCDEYVFTFGQNHPRLNADRQDEVIAALSDFLNDPAYGLDIDVGIEYLQDMTHNFFDRVKSNDHHIFHFANPEILKYCFYNVGY